MAGACVPAGVTAAGSAGESSEVPSRAVTEIKLALCNAFLASGSSCDAPVLVHTTAQQTILCCDLETNFYCDDISPCSVIYFKGVFMPLHCTVYKGRKITTLLIFFLASSDKNFWFSVGVLHIQKEGNSSHCHQSVCWQNLL